MTNEAWIFLAGAWTVIIGLTAFCFWKMLTSDRQLGGDE